MRPHLPSFNIAIALVAALAIHSSDAEQPPPASQPDAIGPHVAAAEKVVRAELRNGDAPLRVIDARAVNWTSGALGCPKPGLSYIEVVTAGYLVVIDAEGTTFYLHSSRTGAPFVCPEGQRQPPLEGRPGDVAY